MDKPLWVKGLWGFLVFILIGLWVLHTAFAPYGWRIKSLHPWGWHIVLVLPYGWHVSANPPGNVTPQYIHSKDYAWGCIFRAKKLWEKGNYDQAGMDFQAELSGPNYGSKNIPDAIARSYLSKLAVMKAERAKTQQQKLVTGKVTQAVQAHQQ